MNILQAQNLLAKLVTVLRNNYLIGDFHLMDYLKEIIEKLKELAQKLIETVLGPNKEPEVELIPIPVDDPQDYYGN
ncbi:hypothetical protein [Candidatus Atelocyanobacterium thalassae]|nr:hypothetical protein [Candidatus Atelocyanobacterium thalassa]